MQSFIAQCIDSILSSHKHLENVVIVLPSQRAKVFVKKELTSKMTVGFLPRILNIEELISEISGFEKIDTIQLLFYFYKVYQSIETEFQDFDAFSSWAVTALQDFNEVDQYLINANDFFAYLRDIKRIQKWSVENTASETELVKSHFSFMEKLGNYYQGLYSEMVKNKKGYQGILYRKAIESLDVYLHKNASQSFYFIGFNALTKAEEILIQRFLQEGNSDIFWDIDNTFLESNHQAGQFIRKYKKEWSFYEKNTIKTISNNFIKPKKITVVGATKNVTQCKEVGCILNTIPDYKNTALVLGDETLLPVTLNSIPKKVEAINITMGYSLKDVPIYLFIKDYFQLYTTQEVFGKQDAFYHKALIRLLKNPIVQEIANSTEKQIIDRFIDEIIDQNISFITVTDISNQFKESVLKNLFFASISVSQFIEQILAFFIQIKDAVSTIEKEYIFRFYNAFIQLKNLNDEYAVFGNLKTLYQFFQQIVSNEKLSFQGEPLSGLQCMGVLETRGLDFENVIITSVNEGVIPKNTTNTSFIPFDVRVQFGLPTYKEKDAIFSYHFFRLLQRAKNIYLLYNTETDSFGKGERSRFIAQLELLRSDIEYKVVSPLIQTTKNEPVTIEKDERTIELLKQQAQKGFSASAIGAYLYNPIDFYKQKILRFQEKQEVEETTAANTMGSIVHGALEELYKPYLGVVLTPNHFSEMQQMVKEIVNFLYPKYLKKGNYKTGKNKLIYEVVCANINRFLKQEKELVKAGNTLKVLEVEKQLTATFQIPGFDFPFNFYGEIDRIDELNGTKRIIDYKTGLVTATNMKIPENWQLNDYKYSKAIQVLLYAAMYTQKEPTQKTIQAGNISFKNLNTGFLSLYFEGDKQNDITEKKLTQFLLSLSIILKEMFDKTVPFLEKR